MSLRKTTHHIIGAIGAPVTKHVAVFTRHGEIMLTKPEQKDLFIRDLLSGLGVDVTAEAVAVDVYPQRHTKTLVRTSDGNVKVQYTLNSEIADALYKRNDFDLFIAVSPDAVMEKYAAVANQLGIGMLVPVDCRSSREIARDRRAGLTAEDGFRLMGLVNWDKNPRKQYPCYKRGCTSKNSWNLVPNVRICPKP